MLDILKTLTLVNPPHLRWRRDALQPPVIQSPQLSDEEHRYFTRIPKNNDIIGIQGIHGMDEVPQAILLLVLGIQL